MSENNNEYTPDLYTLVDEEGNEQTFEMIDALEEGGIQYFALTPYPEDISNDELVILKLDKDENGEEILASIDDDDEFDRIGEIFLQRIDEMLCDEEFEEDEE